MPSDILKSNLQNYIANNEVMFQSYGELMELANAEEKENRDILLSYFPLVSSIEVYSKGHGFIKDEFAEIDSWATEDDLLFLLQNIGVLICIPKKEAEANNLLAA